MVNLRFYLFSDITRCDRDLQTAEAEAGPGGF